ncbi:MAG: AraC family transcriptional regulator [Chitinophagaceae bacterium]
MQTLSKGQFLGNLECYKETFDITASVTSYQRDDRMADSVHYHEHPNFYFVLNDGSIEKRKATQTECVTGSLLFYHAGELHQNIRKGENPRSLNLEIDRTFLSQFGIAENELNRDLLESTNAKLLVLSVYREFITNDALTNASIQLLLLKLFSSPARANKHKQPPLWAQTLKQLLHDRWNENISLQELATLTDVNPITISKHFPIYFTDTLGEYMRKLKVDKALSLIKSTKPGLTDIAYECGFADQSHFTRTFKKYTGFLPLQYKKL